MAAKLIGTTPEGFAIYFGSDADRTAITAPKEGTQFFQDDGSVFIGLGTSGWKPGRIAGAGLVNLRDSAGVEITSLGGGVSGSVTSAILKATNSPASTAGQFVNAEVAKAFDINVGSVVPAGDALLIGWSTTAGDEAAVATNLANLATVWGAPAYTMIPNCIAVPEGSPGNYGAEWDGVTTIKTIAMRLVNGAGPLKFPLAVRT